MPFRLFLKPAVLFLLSPLLSACADVPQPPLVVDEQIVFQMFAGSRSPGQHVAVADARPAAEKVRTKIEGYVQLGDELLSHPPPVAVQIALEEHLAARGTSAGVKKALKEHQVVLQQFQVLAVNQQIDTAHADPRLLPGVAMIDLLVKTWVKSTTGVSRMRILVSFDLGDYRFTSEGAHEFGAMPGSESTAIVFRKAMQPIFRRLEIAFGEPGPG
jgi:hypothetical protein